MNKTLHLPVDIPYIPQFFHPPENLTYPFRISTQRVVIKLYLKFEKWKIESWELQMKSYCVNNRLVEIWK